ncbi:MAG: NADH-quinone oxidoreductase subunit J [Candidatus Latescibacterota bacterium]|jgi:NADH-quinone oxidoreductase subunit J
MNLAFYVAAAVAVAATAMMVTRPHAVHSLLYLVVSLLAVSLIFFLLGAPFAAALEVIVYAGAIMVLFVFVIMMLNLGQESAAQERHWLRPGVWVGPVALALVLTVELICVLHEDQGRLPGGAVTDPRDISRALFAPDGYLLVVELASMLLLAGLVGAYHLGRRQPPTEEETGP